MLIARAPSPPVDALVSAFWYSEDWQPSRRGERIMPDATANLIIALDAPKMVVTGPRSRFVTLRPGRMAGALIGAHFTPSGLAALTRIPASEIRDGQAPLVDLVGAAAETLRERLMAAATGRARVDVLEAWFRDAVRAGAGPEPAIAWAARRLRHPHSRVADVAERIGRSGRWLAETFERDIGLTPKLFNRVRRFHGALRLARTAPRLELADLAVAAGYYDQAHLGHDFVRLGGLPPAALLARATEHINHVAERD